MKKRIVASVEARLGSSRLPAKVLKDICGKPAIKRLFDRLQAAKLIDEVVLATTTSPLDDPLVEWAQKNNIPYFRGSEEDVLNRVVKVHEKMESDIIVEVTGDCPLLDPAIIDWGVDVFLNNSVDVVSNTWKTTFPMGIDIQVFPLKLLQQVEQSVFDAPIREHVSLYFYEHPERYNIFHLTAPSRWRGGDLRFQLDYPEDLEFIKTVYSRLEPGCGPIFGIEEIFQLLREDPNLLKINKGCVEKPVRAEM